MNQFKRILMSAVDAGGSGGSNPAPAVPPVEAPPAPTPPSAPGPSITLTQAELDAKIASVAESAFARARDSFHAEARRVAAPNKPGKPVDPSAALSATEERALLRDGDRTISQLGIKPNGVQYTRFERDLLVDRPVDVAAYTKDYFDGFGGAPAPASAAAVPVIAQPPVAQPTTPPASNRGAPPAPNTSLEISEFARWPQADQLAYLKDKGVVAYRDARNASLKGRPVKLR